MKVGFIQARYVAPLVVAAWAAHSQAQAQTQTQATMQEQSQQQPQQQSQEQSHSGIRWYVGAGAGASHVSLACEPGLACDRTGTAWKIAGGFLWANRTGGEIVYEDFGQASAGALGKLGVTGATVKPRALAFAAVWQPELTPDLSAKFKLGVSTARARLRADADGVPVDDDRKTEPHWWFATGLAWRVAPHWDLTTDVDWTRAGVRNDGHKQTYDVGALTLGAAWWF